MNTFEKVLGWASIVGAVLLSPAYSDAESLGAMRVRLVQGDVQVKIADTREWAPASVNMPLLEGDELWVPEGSRAAVQTIGGTHIRLDEDTAFQVLRMDRDSYQFHLFQGRAYVLNGAARRSVLQFDTPDASLRAFGNSTFRIDVPGGGTEISVFRGSVTAENAGGTTRVQHGGMLALGPDGYAELSPLPPRDEWREWNERRDRIVLARGEGHRHLPDELRVYSSDFEENGRWVNAPDYGYVWTPTTAVSADWAPYRHGRWAWRGGDYVWIGYEPWGWAPYHYGRWAFVVRIGWCWVPPPRGDVFWAPGYVGWVRTGDHVAWVPLAPREVYYGHGHYGRHSVNVTNVNISQVRVTNVYQNINVTNSITVVNQTTFVTGRPAPVERNVVVNVREDFARRRNVVLGSPQIKPVETSYHPVVRSIPEAKRPPERVRKIDAKELKQSRPLVKEPDRSAIRPDAQPRSLEVRKVEKPRTPQERGRVREAAPDKEKPKDAPQERGRIREAPPDKEKPREAPQERGRIREAQPEKEKPKEPPRERGRVREAQPEKDKPKEPPQERGRVREAAPDKEKPREAPQERGRVKEAAPDKEKPKEAPQERGRIREAQPEKDKPKEPPRERGKRKEAPDDNTSRIKPDGDEEREGERGRR